MKSVAKLLTVSRLPGKKDEKRCHRRTEDKGTNVFDKDKVAIMCMRKKYRNVRLVPLN